MANENMIKFLRGNVANLPQTATAGALYFTKDEGIYMGMEDGSYHRYGDFITVADVNSLPTTGAHATCMYYCTAENILARYDATKGWIQINKQPTAEEMKTLLGLAALAYKSEVAEADLNADLAAKINAASGAQHTHDNADVLDGITAEKVTAWDSAEQNAKDYADGLNTAMNTRVEALEAIDHEHANKALLDTYTQTEADLADDVAKKHSHTFNETELNKIVEGDVAKWNAVVADHLTSEDKTTLENAIKEAKKAGTDANTNIEAYKVTNDARVLAVEEDIAEIVDGTNGILAQAKSYTDGKDSAMNTRVAALEAAAPTHATKDELADVDAKFANYNTTVAQKAIDDAQDAEIAKKVNKTDYEADKATFATKTELGDVDAKFANYRTAADQDTIDNGHKERIEALEAKFAGDNSVDAKIAAAVKAEEDARKEAVKGVQDEVDTLEGRMDTAEGKITALEGASATHATKDELAGVDAKFANYKTAEAQKAIDDEQDRRLGELEGASATHATKDELAGVDAKFADYTKTADLPTDLGDFTNNAGYAKTADVNAELAKKADKTQVATDIANAIAPLATTEALNGVKATAEAAAVKTEVEAALALKADKSVVDAMYTNAQIDGFIDAEKQRAEGIEGGLRTDVNTILGDYLKAADKTALQEQITANANAISVITNGIDAEKIDGLNDLIEWADEHAPEVKSIKEDIEANAKAISDHEALATETYETKTDAAQKLTDAKAYTDAEVAKDRERIGALESVKDDYKTADATLKSELQAEIDSDVKVVSDALDAAKTELNTAIETAKTDAANQDAVVLSEAQKYADQAKADAIADAASKYETKGTAQGIVDALKLAETYEPIGAEERAVAAAEGKVNALAATVYTKEEVDAAVEAAVTASTQWGEF